ncbi:MAG TPA: nucleotidyltransferase domain-containing protein [Candidatus Nanoarchaeia archaeon]|nr:nucleotidyltransferase domain-containing protein [Candidatus Nanoarchaeia archaeon]
MVKTHNTEIQIIVFLLNHKKEKYTIREIAKGTSIDYKTVYYTIKDLTAKGVVSAERVGQSHLCSLNQKTFSADIFVAEAYRRAKLLEKKTFDVISKDIQQIKDQFFILLLFGSQAAGKAHKASDIDLLLIVDNDRTQKAIRERLSLLPLPLHLVEFTSEEFLSMLKTTEFNVGKEAFYNNIILFGIEDYYRLVHHA